jgi:filamentous hemagglutinin family protein
MKRVKTILKGRYSRKVIIYLLMFCLVLNTSLPAVLATPSGASPGGGSFSVKYGVGLYDHTTLVNVNSTRTIINWESLDTKGGAVDVRETLAFTQESFGTTLTNSAVLNRISGPATQFNGDLIAPGMRIFMVNPAGIVFGEEATVNVTQLVASGLNMSKDAFNNALDDASKPMIFSGGDGKVENSGTITANSVILVGKKVLNIGSIYATEGLVVMAAGDNVYLAQDGSGVLVELLEDPMNTTDDVQNEGLISAKNGKIVLAAGDTFSRAVSNVGTLSAAGGEVSMQAANVENNGLITVSSTTNGGSVNLTGAESVTIGPDGEGTTGIIEANAGTNGIGGTINITAGTETVEGKVTIEKNSLITATGGSELGIEPEVPDGGSELGIDQEVPGGGLVTITCDNFEIAGDIDASPGNNIFEQGKLVINSPSVIIADGPNPTDLDPPAELAENTLYEEDIENLSQAGTSLIVNAVEGITVKDITDGPDGLDPGVISGQFGSIELHATGENSAVTFVDDTDTIRTSLGDIVIEAGSGGINIGNLTTGKESDEIPNPGQILLSTNNGGDITTGDLLIRTGQGLAKIDVDSSGNLTVNGDVIVGSESDILNVPNGQNAHAAIYLNAADNVELNGKVSAYAQGIDDDITEGDITIAEIRILAGTDQDMIGDAFIKGDIYADAQSSSEGTAEAVIEVDAFGNITFAEGVKAHAIVDNGAAEAGPDTEDDEEFSEEDPPDHAQIIINSQDYPKPPLIGIPDEFSTPKNNVIPVDVLSNDTQDGEPVVDGKIISYTDPTAGSLTKIQEGDKIVSFEYNPPEDLSTLTFDENGKATVTFTYVGKVVIEGEELLSEVTTVTITLVNNLPTAVNDSATTTLNQPININVLTNDTDLDLDDVLTVIEGTVAPKNGTLVLNEDGTFTYTPNKGFRGEDSFKYSATDGSNVSSEVEVKIKVAEAPMYPAPGLDRIQRIEVDISGCPALAKWVAKELGIDESAIEIRMANSLASNKGIQPYDTYSSFRNAALILQDADGSHMAALIQVINEFASSTAPPTEEQMVSIADAIARNTDDDSYYAVADEYLDALVTYTRVMSSEMGVSTRKSAQFITYKYISRLTQDQNVGVGAFLEACLAALGG